MPWTSQVSLKKLKTTVLVTVSGVIVWLKTEKVAKNSIILIMVSKSLLKLYL